MGVSVPVVRVGVDERMLFLWVAMYVVVMGVIMFFGVRSNLVEMRVGLSHQNCYCRRRVF